VRLAIDELLGPLGMTHDGEAPELIAMLAELPDLWDVNLSAWGNDSVTSRFGAEGAQEPYISFVKSLTTKPVVGVGRFTSPDAMVSQVRRGVLDLIGAARPSIADPFLPAKIREGRLHDLRECIGCNICVSGDMTRSPIRCTQNPTMGEEWRRGWHPERVPPAARAMRVLVVGAGPAGLECARILGERGCEVALAERDAQAGGRVLREARLPGLSAWARVVQYRLGQIAPMANVTQFLGHELSAQEILELGYEQVILATGSRWRGDGVGRLQRAPIAGVGDVAVLTPDDLMAGARPQGRALIYDDDHYYMASVLAELLVSEGHAVTFVTPATDVAAWTHNTLEQERIQRRLLELGVRVVTTRQVVALAPGAATLACIYTGQPEVESFDTFVPVTSRRPSDALHRELNAEPERLRAAGILRVSAIGDCWAPATIAAAVYAGHKTAREIDGPLELTDVLRELPALGPWEPLSR
jgi:dimethylamine/trimethylamine dehydrogenase